MESFDVIVVGLGPSGAIVLSRLSRESFRVIGFERSARLGEKPCGGGVPPEVFEISGLKPEHVGANPIRKASVVVEGKEKELDFGRVEGYIVDKERMLRLIVEEAEGFGALVRMKTPIISVESDGRVRLGSGEVLRGKVVVCADGVTGPCVRHFKHYRFVGAYQFTVRSTYDREDTALFMFDRSLDGYMWAFPRGGGLWNVGAGGLKVKAKEWAVKALRQFSQKGRIEVLQEGGAAIPVYGPVPVGAKGRLVAVGDRFAAAMSFTGEGIRPAMITGVHAADQIARFLCGESDSLDYRGSFMKGWGWRLRNSNRILSIFLMMPGFLRRLVIERLNVDAARRLFAGEMPGVLTKFG